MPGSSRPPRQENTLASYLLTQKLLPLIGTAGRVINLSSVAQSPIDPAIIAVNPGSLGNRGNRGQNKETGVRTQLMLILAITVF